MISHEIEPELLRPVPRPVRRRVGRGCALGCVQLFILPHTAVGIGMLLWALHGLTILIGPTVPGFITGRSSVRSSKGGPSYFLHYTYRVGADAHAAKYQVDSSDYSQVPDGTSIGVKVSPFTPEHGSMLLVPGRAPWKEVAPRVFFALFWNGILSVFYWALYVQPWLLRSLVIKGIPVEGTIVGKDVIHGKSTAYRLYYDYRPMTTVQSTPAPSMSMSLPTNSNAWDSSSALSDNTVREAALSKGEMDVRLEDYEAVNIGDKFTVLYAPNRPQRSVIYRFADYEVIR